MALFGRKKKGAPNTSGQGIDPEVAPKTAPTDAPTDVSKTGAEAGAVGTGTAEFPTADTPSGRGPCDSDSKPAPKTHLDLGALYVPRIPGLQLRAQKEPANQKSTSKILLVVGAAGIRVSVAAAPKSGGAWAELREQIESSITSQGGKFKEVEGPYGIEIAAQLPVRLPDSSKALSPLTIIGVDGPRWVIRLDLQGQAVTDERARKVCEAVIDRLIVNRGPEPRIRFELLPLRLPEGAAQAEQNRENAAAAPGDEPAGRPFK